jgi:hypothetical protein
VRHGYTLGSPVALLIRTGRGSTAEDHTA